MSIRSLIEINHDFCHELEDAVAAQRFVYWLCEYLRGCSLESQRALSFYGCKVITQRHHGDDYCISNKNSGFPAKIPYGEDLGDE